MFFGMALKINTKMRSAADNEVTYLLEGNLDNSTAAMLESQMMTTLNAKPRLLIFDLADLKYVTSAGLRLFIMAIKRQKEHGGQVSFVNLQPQIKEVFAIMGSLPDVKVFRDTAELDAYLIARQKTHLP